MLASSSDHVVPFLGRIDGHVDQFSAEKSFVKTRDLANKLLTHSTRENVVKWALAVSSSQPSLRKEQCSVQFWFFVCLA